MRLFRSSTAHNSLTTALRQLSVHDHACLIYETIEEQFDAIVPFIRIGLERSEQCLYIADDNTAEVVVDRMNAAGVDALAAIRAGQLIIATKQETYLKHGRFDPDQMIDSLKCAVAEARSAGFTALRATGEMTWHLGGDPGIERLAEYEAKLNYFFPENDILAVCQYNRNRFSPEVIRDVISTHPLVLYGDTVSRNFYYVPPDEFLKSAKLDREVDRLLANIISREESDTALRESERKYKTLFESSNDGILIADSVTKKYIGANSALCRMVGYTRDEILNLGLNDLHPPENLAFVLSEFERAIKTNTKLVANIPVMRKDGTVFHADVGNSSVTLNGDTFAVGIFRDITERKNAEEAINVYKEHLQTMLADRTRALNDTIEKLSSEVKEREIAEDAVRRNGALLRSVFEGIQDGIAVIDTDQNIIMANHAIEKSFNRGESIGFKTHKCFDVFRQTTVQCENCSAIRAISTNTTQVDKIQYKTTGHGAGWFEMFTFPLRDDRGVAKGTIHYLRDITEKIAMEEQVRRTDHLAALGQISSGIAHEINNPNHIIMLNAELLKSIWQDVEPVLSEYYGIHDDFILGGIPYSCMREHVPQIINRIFIGSTRINDIVVGMKHYTDAAGLAETEKVNINDVVKWCIRRLDAQVKQFTDDFEVHLDDKPLFVMGNRPALETVVSNLVTNALQALTDRTEKVSLFTKRHMNDDCIAITVTDEGAGMTSEVLRQAINPFFTTRQDNGGMGLGLSIVHSVVKNHHGYFDIKSNPKLGTVATVRFPAHHD
jgi:chemotaxis family two-component system sensor kinase Cph1